jgi:hypothetical protein
MMAAPVLMVYTPWMLTHVYVSRPPELRAARGLGRVQTHQAQPFNTAPHRQRPEVVNR